jgi:hypothetical protein
LTFIYKGEKVGRKRVDFIVAEVMVEIKAKSALEPVDFVQTLSLAATWACSSTLRQAQDSALAHRS